MLLHEASLAAQLSLLGAINYGAFLVGYSILRWARLSVDWTTWIIGGLLALLSGANCLFLLVPSQFNTFRTGGQLGYFSVFLGMYAFAQWGARAGYVWGKRPALHLSMQPVRHLFLFLRKHHQFFGWLVLVTAIGHTVTYLPIFTRIAPKWWITGILGLILLGLLIGLGLWIEREVRERRLSTRARLVHIVTAIAFFVVIYLHLAL